MAWFNPAPSSVSFTVRVLYWRSVNFPLVTSSNTGKVEGILSYPYILAISSIKSSLIEISLRREGTYTVKVSAFWIVLNPNCSKIALISSFDKLKPIVWFTFSAVISIGVTSEPKSPCATLSFNTSPEA